MNHFTSNLNIKVALLFCFRSPTPLLSIGKKKEKKRRAFFFLVNKKRSALDMKKKFVKYTSTCEPVVELKVQCMQTVLLNYQKFLHCLTWSFFENDKRERT